MENFSDLLSKQLEEINNLLKISNRNIARLKDLPDIKVHVSRSNGCHQYYLPDITDGDESKAKFRYAKTSERKLVQKLVQRDYEKAVNRKLLAMKKTMERFINSYDVDGINEIYNMAPEGRKALIKPIIETDEQYIEKWLTENKGEQNPYPEKGQFLTSKGEYVRSKSELIIADMLAKYGIPYRYEPCLILSNYYSVYPDFIVLNVDKRKSYYWEHLGLISDPDYAIKNFSKLQTYENNGYLIGKNLIVTMESQEKPLDVKLVERKIKEYML